MFYFIRRIVLGALNVPEKELSFLGKDNMKLPQRGENSTPDLEFACFPFEGQYVLFGF